MSTEPQPISEEVRPEVPATPETAAPEEVDPAVLRAQLAEVTRQKEQLLEEKSNSEKRNQRIQELESENERLRTGAYQPPTPGQQPDAGLQRFRDGLASLEQRAREGDNEALAIVAVAGMLERLPSEFRSELALTEVPKDERLEVQRVIAERARRGERISPETARELRQAEKQREQIGALEARVASLGKQEQERAEGVRVTHRAPAVPLQNGGARTMTYSEYDQAMQQAEGDPDKQRQLRDDRRSGRLQTRPG